jgi:serine/threonine-protein kinase RsbW
MPSYSFRYPSRLESEEQMFDDFEAALKESGVRLKDCRGFLLAVSEAFNNAMVHGNESNPSKQVVVRLDVKETDIIADILDEGQGGLARLQARIPRGLLAEGGRGIDLIAHFADSVDYSQHASGGLLVTISIARRKVQTTQ